MILNKIYHHTIKWGLFHYSEKCEDTNMQKEVTQKSMDAPGTEGSIVKDWKRVKPLQQKKKFSHQFHFLQGHPKMST